MAGSAQDENPQPVKLAIVGCGAAAAQCHVPGLAAAPPGVELVALVDPVHAHAQQLSEMFAPLSGRRGDLLVTTDLDAIIGRADAAILSAPHAVHAALAVRLARAGIHCLVEKPMALTVEECDRMSAEAQRCDVLLALAFVRRLFPASPWIKAMLAERVLGDAVERIDWREGAAYDWPLVTPSLFVPGLAGGGALADGGSHVLDLILWWLGAEGPSNLAYRDTSLGGVEADARIDMIVRDVEVTVELSRLRTLSNTCRITGTRASVEFGIDVESPFVIRDRAGRIMDQGVVPCRAPAQAGWAGLFAEQARNFAAAVRGTEPIYAGAADGRRVTALIQACYRRRAPLPAPWREVRAS